MENLKKWLIAGFAIMLCLVIVLAVWVGSLSKRLTELEHDHRNLFDDVSELYQELYGLRAELNAMEEAARDAASLFETVEYNLVGASSETGTGRCRFYIVPKLISEEMELVLTVGDTTHSLVREGSGFASTVEFPLFAEDIPVVTVKTSAGTQNEKLEEVDLFWASREWLPELIQTMSGISSTAKDWVNVDLAYGVKYNNGQSPVTFVKFTEIKTVNGEEISNRDVTAQLRDGGESGFYEFYTGYPYKGEEDVVVTVRAEDSLGYIHELQTEIVPSTEPDGCPETNTGFESIYTSDGTLLFGE